MKEGKAHIERPLAISIVSIIVFFLGFSGTVLGIVSLGLNPFLSRVNVSPSFIGVFVYLTIFWLVVGPLLTLTGYNLWKMKKWAAQLVTISAGVVVQPWYIHTHSLTDRCTHRMGCRQLSVSPSSGTMGKGQADRGKRKEGGGKPLTPPKTKKG